MHRFYVDKSQINNNSIIIIGPDVNHIKNVLRIKTNEKITVSDGQSKEYYCIIEKMDKTEIVLKIESFDENNTELKSQIILFQAIPKKDKMELIIQKAVELGVSQIVPVVTNRVIVKIDDEKREIKKMERWQNISENAAKQSRRGIIPIVKPIHSFNQAIEHLKDLDISLMPYENARGIDKTKEIISTIKDNSTIGIFIGSEGGFTENEIEVAKQNNIIPISLGRRILRTETAGLAILSMLMLELDE
ncbi:MAG TPA: 16S rRNA (uracil(1498)-N(3))-methyltransferase [Clostridiales bacterium]|nr:16S rRNA (uracil(1498)-N(3))-methyltransferase [Clostridiales bacterium]